MEHIQQTSLNSDQFVSLSEPHMQQQHHETLQQIQQHQHIQHQHHQLQMYQQQQQQQQHDTHLQLHHQQQQQQSSHHQQQQTQQSQQQQAQAPHLNNASTLNQQQHRMNRPINPRSSLGRNVSNLPFRPHQNTHAIHAASTMTPNAPNYLRQVTAATPTDFPLRMLVQNDMVGAIIGRSGGTIRQITQQSKARIDVHREENSDQQEKIITIGGLPEACSTACQKILEVMLQEAMSNNNNHSTDIPLKILAYNNLIGRLIGKSGASIKKIMEATNTKINVSANNFSDWSNERVITIEGNLENIYHAEQVISAKLRAAHVSDLSVTMQALNQQQHFTFLGLNPMSLMSGPYSQHPVLSTIVNSQAGHSGHGSSRVAGPHQASSHLSGGHMYTGPPGYLPPIYPNIGGPSTHGGSSGPLLGFTAGLSGMENERETVYLYIPNQTVGAVIGKYGSTIKEMINSSGATIKVAAADPSASSLAKIESSAQPTDVEIHDQSGQNLSQPKTTYNANPSSNSINERNVLTRRVSIVGTPESQWTAQYLIYRKVSMESSTADLSLMAEIHVPSTMVGKIIGKAGLTVKHIQKQTRTIIRLPEERTTGTGEESETPVYITGEFHNSQIAQRQIRNLIKDNLYQYRSKQHQLSRQQHDNKDGNQNNDVNSRQNEHADQDPSHTASNNNDQVDSVDSNVDQKQDPSHAETACVSAKINSDPDTNRNSDDKSELDQRLGVTHSSPTPPRSSSPGPQINNGVNTQHLNSDNEHKKELEAEIKNGITSQRVVQDNSGDGANTIPVNDCKS